MAVASSQQPAARPGPSPPAWLLFIALRSPAATTLIFGLYPLTDWPQVSMAKHTTVLHVAMIWSSPAAVGMLLDARADPHAVDKTVGHNALMKACLNGRDDQVALWLDRFPLCNLEQKDHGLSGMSALHWALYHAPTSAAARLLLSRGASVASKSSSGRTVLHSLTLNEDCEAGMLATLLERIDGHFGVDAPIAPRGLKWALLNMLFTYKYRSGLRSKRPVPKFTVHVAFLRSSTALHCAARRGDAGAIRLLLEAGADPQRKNGLGLNAASVCTEYMGPMYRWSGLRTHFAPPLCRAPPPCAAAPCAEPSTSRRHAETD